MKHPGSGKMPHVFRGRVRVTRDGVLFAVGLAGITYETLVENVDRPTLLLIFSAMVGLPVFLKADEKGKDE